MRPDPKNLRVSDAEREHVVEILQHAVGRGLLDLTEFSARSETALGARTRAELNSVLLDLPGVVHTGDAPPPDPVDDAAPTVLTSTLSGVQRTGPWPVPRRLVVRCWLGSAKLDFTKTRIDHPEVAIDLEVAAGSVILRVPRSASVAAETLDIVLGRVHDRRRTANLERGTPHFVVTGTIRAGSLVIRRPWNVLG